MFVPLPSTRKPEFAVGQHVSPAELRFSSSNDCFVPGAPGAENVGKPLYFRLRT